MPCSLHDCSSRWVKLAIAWLYCYPSLLLPLILMLLFFSFSTTPVVSPAQEKSLHWLPVSSWFQGALFFYGCHFFQSSCFAALLTCAPALAGPVLLLICRIILRFLSSVFLPPSRSCCSFFSRSGTEPCRVSLHHFTNGRI